MDWSIHYITSSPRFPHGNTHVEKAVGIVTQIYERCQDIKLGLLLLKSMPITNQSQSQNHQAPGNVFFGHTLKAHLPIYQSITNTCTLGTENSAALTQNDILSKYGEDQEVWIKLDSQSKWMPGKIVQVLPNQSYNVKPLDGCVFQRNQHHLTRRLSCLKPRVSEAGDTSPKTKSYHLRPRKDTKHVQWSDIPAEAKQGTVDFDIKEL